MMASQLLQSLRVVKKASSVLTVVPVRLASVSVSDLDPDLSIIGNREVVGPGINNQLNYFDKTDVPLPAIRYRPNDAPGVQALREKEKGDWHKLTLEEKKALYRASFRQTLVESEAPDTFWKSIVGCSFFTLGLAIWIMMWLKTFALDPLPASLSLENRQWQLQRVLDLELEPIEGISSKYDYEKRDWKK